jgi:hypothetical protein
MTTPEKTRKPLWRRLLKWSLRLAILLVVLLITTYAIASYWAASTIQSEIAKIREANQPLTFIDLDKLSPKVPLEQDAGPFYIAATALVRPINDDKDLTNSDAVDALLTNPSPELLVWAQRQIDNNQTSLDLLDRGSLLPGCNADIQLQFGLTVALTHFGPARTLLNSASLRTRILAFQGKGDAAVDSLLSSLGLLRIFDRQPSMIDTLVQWAMIQKISRDASVVLSFGHPSDASLQKLSDAFKNSPPISVQKMLIGERVYFLKLVQETISSNPPENAGDLPLPESNARLGITGRILTATALPDYAAIIKAANADWPTAGTDVKFIANQPKSMWNAIGILGPSIGHATEIGQRTVSSHRAILIAIQIERYRLAHNGQLPNSLADLPNSADLPKDPFSAAPFTYQKKPDSYSLFASNQQPSATTKPTDFLHFGGIQIRTNTPPENP